MFFDRLKIPGSKLENRSLYLRAPLSGDCQQWLQLREQSRHFLEPFEPLWASDDLKPSGFRRRLRLHRRESKNRNGEIWFIFSKRDHQLMGGISISNIRLGPVESATLGYWMGKPYAGKGHMKAALTLLLPYAMQHHCLKRLEAACLLHNEPSIHLLQSLGFEREGKARKYLQIAGKRQDHWLYAFTHEE